MKCPKGTVEVSVWYVDGYSSIYFDSKRDCGTNSDVIREIESYGETKELNGRLLEKLKSIIDLGPHRVVDDCNVYLFEPETFEELTEGVEE